MPQDLGKIEIKGNKIRWRGRIGWILKGIELKVTPKKTKATIEIYKAESIGGTEKKEITAKSPDGLLELKDEYAVGAIRDCVVPAFGKHLIDMSPKNIKRTLGKRRVQTNTISLDKPFTATDNSTIESIVIALRNTDGKWIVGVPETTGTYEIVHEFNDIYGKLDDSDKSKISKELGLAAIRALAT